MAQNLPTTTSQYTVWNDRGLDGLQLHHNAPLPPLSNTACLVKIAAVSLNYRDVAMPTGVYPMRFKGTVIPCSDAAGTVVAVGKAVKLHQVGDRVCTLFTQGHQLGFTSSAIRETVLGSRRDGVLRKYAVYDETGLVAAPKTLSMIEASTLPCATVTAWNTLYGIADRSLDSGDTVLVQGTGGVSLFAAQFAQAAGATVIATTSSDAKAEKLRRDFGIQQVINYKTEEQWGDAVKKLTPDSEGVHHIIEVGGECTMQQSLKAIRSEGVVSIIGFLGGQPKAGEALCSFANILTNFCVVRGVNVGSRQQMEVMNAFIDEHGIKPVVDKKIFGFEEAREAYQYLLDQKHFGKVIIKVDE